MIDGPENGDDGLPPPEGGSRGDPNDYSFEERVGRVFDDRFAVKILELMDDDGMVTKMLDTIVIRVRDEVIQLIPQVQDVESIATRAAQIAEGHVAEKVMETQQQIQGEAQNAQGSQVPAQPAVAPAAAAAPTPGERILKDIKEDPKSWVTWGLNQYFETRERFARLENPMDVLSRIAAGNNAWMMSAYVPDPMATQYPNMLAKAFQKGFQASQMGQQWVKTGDPNDQQSSTPTQSSPPPPANSSVPTPAPPPVTPSPSVQPIVVPQPASEPSNSAESSASEPTSEVRELVTASQPVGKFSDLV